jgi:hypothetical protein
MKHFRAAAGMLILFQKEGSPVSLSSMKLHHHPEEKYLARY